MSPRDGVTDDAIDRIREKALAGIEVDREAAQDAEVTVGKICEICLELHQRGERFWCAFCTKHVEAYAIRELRRRGLLGGGG